MASKDDQSLLLITKLGVCDEDRGTPDKVLVAQKEKCFVDVVGFKFHFKLVELVQSILIPVSSVSCAFRESPFKPTYQYSPPQRAFRIRNFVNLFNLAILVELYHSIMIRVEAMRCTRKTHVIRCWN